jgi:hypothetical protein
MKNDSFKKKALVRHVGSFFCEKANNEDVLQRLVATFFTIDEAKTFFTCVF